MAINIQKENQKKAENKSTEKTNAVAEKGTKIDINILHAKLGHPSEEVLKSTAKYMKLQITGKFETCENCAVSKIQQKNIRKSPKEKSKIPGHRLYVDTSGKLTLSAGGLKYWLLVADEALDMKFSFFMKKNGHKRKTDSTLKGIVGHIQNENKTHLM